MTTWRLEFDNRAARQLLKLGSTDRQRIRDYLDRRVLTADDPRQLGNALTGDLAGLWRYRVGHLRIVARIEDRILVIVVVEIGNRREVYR